MMMMQAKRLLGVVVGSTDPGHHQRSLDQGEEAAKIIEEYGIIKIIKPINHTYVYLN